MNDKKSPARVDRATTPASSRSSSGDIEAFLKAARSIIPATKSHGRLVFALDATMSRQPTWDIACDLQSAMFDAAGKDGKLAIQLLYFRGFNECRASHFVSETGALKDLMVRIDCRGGQTQISKVFSHILKENKRERVNAAVFIGDAMEETVDMLAHKAAELGMHGVPVFMFQEGHDPKTEAAFKEFARLSRGAWFRFDRSAPATLARLLSSVAVYATGGFKALEKRGTREDRLLIENLRGSGR